MTRITWLLAALGLLVASVAAGAVVSNGLADSETELALPEREQAIPVIGPSDGAFGAAEDDGAGGGNGGGAGEDGVPASDPIGVVEPYMPPGGGDPSTLRFIDPCADGEGEPCDGVGSTVLGFHDAPPFEILNVNRGYCGERRAGTFPIGEVFSIYSTTPAEFTVTATDRRGSGLTRDVLTSTGAGEAAAFAAYFDDDPATTGFADPRVITCFGIVFPNRSTQWDLVIVGSVGDQSDVHEMTITVDATGGRPPVRIDDPLPPFEDRLHVVVPAKSGINGRVVVRLLSNGGGATGDQCRAYEPSVLSDRSTRTTPIPSAELGARDYPYDQAYDHRYDHTFDTLTPGARYDLCIWWIDGVPGRIAEKVVYPILSPQRYTVFFRVARVDFTHARNPASIEVSTFGGACRFHLPGGEATRHQEYGGHGYVPTSPSGEQPCNHSNGLAQVPGSAFDIRSFDPMLRVEVTRGDTTLADYLHLPLSPCPVRGGACDPSEDFTEDYVVSLGSVTVGLCGSSFGDCDPPTERVGSITLRLRFLNRGHEGGRSWEIGEPTTF